MTHALKWVSLRPTSLDCNWLRCSGLSATTTLNPPSHSSMPWTAMAVLPLLFGLLLSTDAFSRVKRQYGSPTQWSFDQGSYQQPYGYRESYEGYYPQADYHSYYTQRAIIPHHAPPSWSLEGYNSYYSFMYPFSQFGNHYSHHSSSYAIKPDLSRAGSSYARPPMSGEVTRAPPEPTTQPPDEYPTGPQIWEGGPDEKFFVKGVFPPFSATTKPSRGSSTKGTSSIRYFEGEGFDESGPFMSHGVEVTGEGDPTGLIGPFLKAAVEEDINETEGSSSSVAPEEENGKSSTTTMNPEEEGSGNKPIGVIEEITGSTPTDDRSSTPKGAVEEATALFVDSDDPSVSSSTGPSTTTTTESNSSSKATDAPQDEYVPTEVPAAESSEEPTESTSSEDTVILRSPPLPKQVAEKLKELGFSVLRFFF
ncbi:unnamed protein product [Haemonchus placei]|uniref:DUF4794 domain-containing protein n=1 Tax=Haemonchus placei TaxID=6290 RepID=A0A0N4WUE6_HAEPC|nr:unnamed protein product [Haemonchus placei]